MILSRGQNKLGTADLEGKINLNINKIIIITFSSHVIKTVDKIHLLDYLMYYNVYVMLYLIQESVHILFKKIAGYNSCGWMERGTCNEKRTSIINHKFLILIMAIYTPKQYDIMCGVGC